MVSTIYDNLHEAVASIRSKTQLKPRVGIILGSGMGNVAEVVKPEVVLEYIRKFLTSVYLC